MRSRLEEEDERPPFSTSFILPLSFSSAILILRALSLSAGVRGADDDDDDDEEDADSGRLEAALLP